MLNIKKSLLVVVASLSLAFVPALTAGHHGESDKKTSMKTSMAKTKANPNIVALAASNKDLSTLVAAVKAAKLVSTLSSPGPFTVFAPNNAAFDKLPEGTVASLLEPENKDTLTGILTYHVVSGEVMAADLVKAITDNDGEYTVATVNGGSLTATIIDGDVILKDANGGMSKVIATDVDASNGVVHLIDSVVLPK